MPHRSGVGATLVPLGREAEASPTQSAAGLSEGLLSIMPNRRIAFAYAF